MIKIKAHYIFIAIIFLIFLSFLFFKNHIDKNNANYFFPELMEEKYKTKENSKVIIIGDSRFKRIIRDREEYIIPNNFLFIAKSATGIDWFKNEAVPKLKTIIKNEKYSYHVVFNMGINDIQFIYNYSKVIPKYEKEIKKLKQEFPSIHFYILSINPIDEKLININFPNNIRTMNKIKYFNSKLIDFCQKNNITYCDSANQTEFMTVDGIHYASETNQEILYYIANKCIDYSRKNL